ncbi:hypothetical protein [Azospirillum isscasi]|uniref:Integral membrane protein n=1 Tax=Azospirillum isscasi TaxID=3053926 RepID=A0ABU0WB00_9PROT|nr:hypothetical protein [Azospirillum isscasi]MDQ2101267.1 hypothetical protein [Azospirillum isscasi]
MPIPPHTGQHAPDAPPPNPVRTLALGALAGLAILKAVMLAGQFTQTEPYPPLQFAPLFASSLALSALCAALMLVRSRWFALPTAAVILESLLSFGPHKLYPGPPPVFAQTVAVYPAIAVGSVLIGVLAAASWKLYRPTARGRSHGSPA